MSNLASQRRIAASVLKCGVNRIWFDPDQGSEIENAISREDVRKLVGDGVIRAHAKKGVSRARPDREAVLRPLQGPRSAEGRQGCPHAFEARLDPEDPGDPQGARRAPRQR